MVTTGRLVPAERCSRSRTASEADKAARLVADIQVRVRYALSIRLGQYYLAGRASLALEVQVGKKYEVHVGKKYAIYLPKAIVNALNLKEGGKLMLRLAGTSLVLESVQDPIQLAIHGKKFASITPDRVEAISLEEQQRETQNSA